MSICKDFSGTAWLGVIKFGTKLCYVKLYCVTKNQPHIAYLSLYFLFLSLKTNFLWKCYNLWWLPPGVCELCSLLAIFYDWIFFILAGYKDMHESLDEFEFQPDTTADSWVICPVASKILMFNVVTTLAPSFLIGYSSYLQITRTFIFSNEFEIRPDWTKDCGVSCPWASGKISIDL